MSKTITAIVKDNSDNFKSLAVRNYDFNRMTSSIIRVVSQSNALQNALKTSYGIATMKIACENACIIGLPLDPMLGLACFVPREKNKEIGVEYQVMKAGYVELAKEKGIEITTTVIHEKDTYIINETSETDSYSISPCIPERGDIILYLASATFPNGKRRISYITQKEALEFGCKHASSYKIRDILKSIDPDKNIKEQFRNIQKSDIEWNIKESIWLKGFEEQASKTVVKKLAKRPEFGNIIYSALNVDNGESYSDVSFYTAEEDEKQKESAKRVIKARVEKRSELINDEDPSPFD